MTCHSTHITLTLHISEIRERGKKQEQEEEIKGVSTEGWEEAKRDPVKSLRLLLLLWSVEFISYTHRFSKLKS